MELLLKERPGAIAGLPIEGTFREIWYSADHKKWWGEITIDPKTGEFEGELEDQYGKSGISGKILKSEEKTLLFFEKRYWGRGDVIAYLLIQSPGKKDEWIGQWRYDLDKTACDLELKKVIAELAYNKDTASCVFAIPPPVVEALS